GLRRIAPPGIADGAGQQLGSVAAARPELGHAHPGPDAEEGEQLGRMRPRIEGPIVRAAIARGDDLSSLPGGATGGRWQGRWRAGGDREDRREEEGGTCAHGGPAYQPPCADSNSRSRTLPVVSAVAALHDPAPRKMTSGSSSCRSTSQ